MMQWLLIAVGGALGALGRYWVSTSFIPNSEHTLPLGTLTANVVGSLLMGMFYVLVLERAILPADIRPLVMVGFLGAFTTFSSFSLESVALMQQGHMMPALIYISLSVVCCVAATAAAIVITRVIV